MVYYKVVVYEADTCIGVTPKCRTPMAAAKCAFKTIIFPLECKFPLSKRYLDGVGATADECFEFLVDFHDMSVFDDFKAAMKSYYDEGCPPAISGVELLTYDDMSEENRLANLRHKVRKDMQHLLRRSASA